MSMFDEFYFDTNFDQLPRNIPHDGWQTKDLDCTLSVFRVIQGGLVLRKGNRNDKDAFYFSDRLSGHFGIYHDEDYLILVIRNGVVTDIVEGDSVIALGIDLNWQPFSVECN